MPETQEEQVAKYVEEMISSLDEGVMAILKDHGLGTQGRVSDVLFVKWFDQMIAGSAAQDAAAGLDPFGWRDEQGMPVEGPSWRIMVGEAENGPELLARYRAATTRRYTRARDELNKGGTYVGTR